MNHFAQTNYNRKTPGSINFCDPNYNIILVSVTQADGKSKALVLADSKEYSFLIISERKLYHISDEMVLNISH